MFVLPPPPRYPINQLQGGLGGPMIETSNTLSTPSGPEYQLAVGEGTYVLRDDLHLATPPPHPSEAPVHNPNPLATTKQPPSAGTRLSLAILTSKTPSYAGLYRLATKNSTTSAIPPSIQEHPNESQSQASDAGSTTKVNGFGASSHGHVPGFGEGNPALAMPNGKELKDPTKKRKPKSNIVKSNSSFVSRVIPHESLTKRMQERSPDGILAFANINRALQWLDLSSPQKDEHLTKILFTKAHALCHDVNLQTKGPSHIDMILGFSTSDLIWYEPISQKYARLNKNGAINATPISDIKWIPNSENLFMAAHFDGALVVYDKEKEDAPFVPEESTPSTEKLDEENKPTLRVKKSVQSRNQKANPISYWQVSHSKINSFAFSPDRQHLAVVSEDGTLRVIDYLKEQLIGVYTSYYGGLISVCWSPDGRYVVTGGQDDLVSIWSLEERILVARCQGHNSWVTDVAFDPWRCDDRNYRFGSVGEDCRLLLWDFSVGMLHHPRAASVRQRGSVSSHLPLPKRTDGSGSRHRSNSNLSTASGDDEDGIVHPVEPRARTAMLPPVMSKSVDDHPLCWLAFEEDSIITSCKDGHVRTWDRPKESSSADEEALSAASGSNR